MPAEIAEHLLHALREALSNAARHGQASRVDVTVLADGKLILLVRDNGTGIKATTRRSGLANLAQRADHYGGTLTVEPGRGRRHGARLAGAAAPGHPGDRVTARRVSGWPAAGAACLRSSNTRAA